MNKWTGYGRVGNDPDFHKFTNGNEVAKFSFATSEKYKDKNGNKVDKTEWHNCVFFGKAVDLIRNYVEKGSALIIEGKLTYRQYEDKQGNRKYFTEIVGFALHFTGSAKKEETNDKPQGNKITTGSMSNPDDLPGNVDNGNIPEDNEPPY